MEYYLMSQDGKNYVMKNPLQEGRYLSTTSSVKATGFTYKQARQLLNNARKSTSWIKKYHMVEKSSGEAVSVKRSNADVYAGENKIEIDLGTLDEILLEANNIKALNAWDLDLLVKKEDLLNTWLSYIDSSITDIEHVIGDESPPAHIRTKIYTLLHNRRQVRKRIKQQLSYIRIMKESINEGWTVQKLQEELKTSDYQDYKGRTDDYKLIMSWISPANQAGKETML